MLSEGWREEGAARSRRVLTFVAFALSTYVLAAAPGAEAAPKSVVIIPSSSHVTAVVAAAGRMNVARFADVTLKVIDSASQTPADLDAIARADIFILFNVGQLLARDLAPTIARQQRNGGRAWVVGQEYTDVERQSGFLRDQAWADYAVMGGVDNYYSLLRVAYARARNQRMTNPPVVPLPEEALWEPTTGRLFEQWADFEREYLSHRPSARGRRWVGVPINRGDAVSGQMRVVNAVVAALERRGFNAAVSVGYPADGQIERFYFDEDGRPRVSAIVAMAMKFGNVPDRIVPILSRLDVPILNAVTTYNKTREEWEASPIGIPQEDRSWQIANPEFAGAVAPTVIASSERRHDDATGIDYKEETPIADRVELLADRVKALITLRTESAARKRIALVYYNYPPGQENIGASYLNVMPHSLWQMLTRLEREGYTTTGRPADTDALFRDVTQKGVNINASSPGELERLVRRNSAVLLPVSEYNRWLRAIPQSLVDAMNAAWGKPEDARIMTWRDDKGIPYFVFPVVRYGNVVLAPQPTRGWDQDSEKALHEIVLPPHHQYLAFYLWLQKGLQANAVVHIGTHGTMEWMPGKEVGQSAADPSEAMLGAMPVMYPYIMDVIGEGLQARRRGMAALISYLTPPMDKAGLNPELVTLKALLDNYT
ncbi:MAG: cobaltochelatase subunit CobN, partial [Vicinamibacterales bacterium]